MSLKKVIGISSLSYPEKRNFAGYDLKNYTFKKIIDFYKFPSFFLYRLRHKINRKWQNTFSDFGLNKCDFFHFFNVISLGKKPFITTYETTLPRWNDFDTDFKKGLEILAGKNCRQIIAISECALKKQEAIVRKFRPDLIDAITSKNMVLLPPQPLSINHLSEKRKLGETLVFTIVGADFFRKGGMSVLKTFDNLLDRDKPLFLNIVSTLNYGDYASKTSKVDLEAAKSIIEKHNKKINVYNKLSNKEVEQLLLNTDVALLPSLAETFGYFILEAQAAGCPVISTDIRAMPEINNESKGWLINIREPGSDDADLNKTAELNDRIQKELTAIIQSILENPAVIAQKGKLALMDILNYHSPEKHKEKLLEIYDRIL